MLPSGLPGLMWLKPLKASMRNFVSTLSQIEKDFVMARSVLKNDGPKYVLAPAFPILSNPGNENSWGCGVQKSRLPLPLEFALKPVRLVFMCPLALGRQGAAELPVLCVQSWLPPNPPPMLTLKGRPPDQLRL